jgi:hypothetical protein
MSRTQIVEVILDGAAAAWAAVCIAASVGIAAGSPADRADIVLLLSVSAVAAVATYRILAGMRSPGYAIRAFDLMPVEASGPEAAPVDLPELLLTSAQMVIAPPPEESPEELVLNDVLAEIKPNSRVVQLFDPNRIPTAGELKSRIDRHLGDAGRVGPPGSEPDASQALYDALADLRRSLA